MKQVYARHESTATGNATLNVNSLTNDEMKLPVDQIFIRTTSKRRQ